MNATEIEACLHELQVFFAGKAPGWRERATPGQIAQHDDRVREHDALLQTYLRMTEAE